MSDLNHEESKTEEGDARNFTPEVIVEALLFSTDQPLSASKLVQLLGVGDTSDVKQYIEKLNQRYDQADTSFRIDLIAKGYRMLTRPEFNPWVGKLHKSRADTRLSSAALETLAIVAYKQPVLRADIESVRGVAVGDMLVRLREMNLVRIVGRAEDIGRPLLYGTTNKFLEVFGLSNLKDLPKLDPEKPNDVPKLKIVQAESDREDITPKQVTREPSAHETEENEMPTEPQAPADS